MTNLHSNDSEKKTECENRSTQREGGERTQARTHTYIE